MWPQRADHLWAGPQRPGTHSEEVGAALGLLAYGRRRVAGLGHVDAELLLAGAGRRRHRGGVVTQAATTVTGLIRDNENISLLRRSCGGADKHDSPWSRRKSDELLMRNQWMTEGGGGGGGRKKEMKQEQEQQCG